MSFYTDGKAQDAVRLLSNQLTSDLKEPLTLAIAERAAKILGESKALTDAVNDAKRVVGEASVAAQRAVTSADRANAAAERSESTAKGLAERAAQAAAERGRALLGEAQEAAAATLRRTQSGGE